MSWSDFSWFQQYVVGATNRKGIISRLQLSRKTIWIRFKPLFLHPPDPILVWKVAPPTCSSSLKSWIYSVDGKWHKRKGVTLIHRDVTHHEVLWWSKARSESYQALLTDLDLISQQLAGTGSMLPVGVVSDWKQSMVSNVSLCFNHIPHQRCLFHVKKNLRSLLPKHSPLEATLALREIGMALTTIKSWQDKEAWVTWLTLWEILYGELLTEKSYPDSETTCNTHRRWWYTHKNLRRAHRILVNDQDNLFVHLSCPLIPMTNNGIEGLNADIKGKLHEHRGIPYDFQYAFIAWLLTFRRIKKRPQLRHLWAEWNRINNSK